MGKKTKRDASNFDATLEDIKEELLELEQMLKIDEDNLDKVIREHPVMFFRIGTVHTSAVSVRDTLKDKLVSMRHEVYLEVRSEADEGNKKLTEANVTAMIETDERIGVLKHDLVEANQVLGTASALKDAFAQRSFAVRDIVSLTVHSNMVHSSISVAANERHEETRGKLAKHRKKKRVSQR